MSRWKTRIAISKADFLERTRGASFRLSLCLVLYLGFAVNSGQILIRLGDYRGIYNSAWVGSLAAVVVTFFLGLFGFYLVKGGIERDRVSGAGQILAASSLTRLDYLLGKWLSSFAVLAALVGLLALAAVLMQFVQGEVRQVEAWALFAPLLLLALPVMALTAALALFFETVPWLRGGFGSLVYFFVFIFLLVIGVFLPQYPWLDAIGLNLVGASMRAAVSTVDPGYGGMFTLSLISGTPLKTFVWAGLDWSVGLAIQRMVWVGLALGLVLLGGLFFDRFEGVLKEKKGSAWWSRLFQPFFNQQAVRRPAQADIAAPEYAARAVRLDLPAGHFQKLAEPIKAGKLAGLIFLAWLEGLLLLKGLAWYWLAGMGLFWLGSLAAPTTMLREICFLLCAIWPVLVWSKLGARDSLYQTGELVCAAPQPHLRPLLAAWLAGIAITALACSGALAGRILHGEALGLAAWGLSVAFIPSLALGLGTASGSTRMFEVVYPILWYLGPLNPHNSLVVLDYLGVHSGAPVHTTPLMVVGMIGFLVGVGGFGKRTRTGR